MRLVFAGGDCALVKRSIETTAQVTPRERWDYWKEKTLAAVDAKPVYGPQAFTAFRTIVQTELGTLIDSTSEPMSLRRTQSKIARDGVDHACLVVPLRGSGVVDQQNRSEDVLRRGDLFLYDLGRPYTATSLEPYHELRLYVPREVFARRVGRIEMLSGLRLNSQSGLVGMFEAFLAAYSKSLPTLTDRQATIGMEGVLHLLAGLVSSSAERADTGSSALSAGLIKSLALRHIEALLADPMLDVDMLSRVTGVSRTRLYNAFVESRGVASAIRDARLDRARLQLSAQEHRHRTMEDIAHLCGFVEYTTFTKAFRRRFGLSPRDARMREAYLP
jgi:AraC-like DNA-binding protein